MSDHFFVVTGGPGAGKTSLITELARRGFHTIPESGRAIIREEMASGGDALPWGNRMAFAERMLERDLRAHEDAQALSGPVIFGQGIPDIMGYLTFRGLPVPPHIAAATKAQVTTPASIWHRIGMISSHRTSNGNRPASRPKQPAPSCERPTRPSNPNHEADARRLCPYAIGCLTVK